MKKILFASLALIVSGCSSIPSIERHSPTISEKVERIQSYEIGKLQKSYVGDAIIEKAYLKYTVIGVESYKAIKSVQSKDSRFSIAKNREYPIIYEDKEDDSVYIKADFPNMTWGIKIDRDGRLLDEHPYYHNLVWQNHAMVNVGIGSVGEKLFIPSESNKELDPESFKVEIIYLGMDGPNIRAAYREYKDDIARPAFYQDITYNISQSKTIRYKNYKIQVNDATNEYIEYTVIED